MSRRRPTTADLRERARAITFRHPVFTAVMMQVSFWLVANSFLVVLMNWLFRAAAAHTPGLRVIPLKVTLPLALALAVAYGVVLGLIDQWLERRSDPNRAWGIRIILKAVLYSGTFVVLAYSFFSLLSPLYMTYFGSVPNAESKRWMLMALLLFASLGNLLISLIKEVNRGFGPGLLRMMLIGAYRRPQVEKRIFMFMDLRGSTGYAETLGHLRYSAMVRDVFQDVNRMVPRYEAEIYQYVGDEVVLTWNKHRGADAQRCLLLFFAVQDAIAERADIYRERYGMVPEFKAGVHTGTVTAVEIGDIKREIAYHGDTVNTAARIESMNNSFDRQLLVSDQMLMLCGDLSAVGLREEPMGSILLKGKSKYVTIHAVERIATVRPAVKETMALATLP